MNLYLALIAGAFVFFFLVFMWSLLNAASQADRTLDDARYREIVDRWTKEWPHG